MDSFTQITLGAAVGEVVLGKKIGNRAIFWGAVAGTVPDLDILSNFVTDEMTALAFHRGLTHSFFFAVTAPFAFAWFTDRLYSTGLYQKKNYKRFAFGFWMLMISAIFLGLNFLPELAGGQLSYTALGLCTFLLLGIFFLLWRNYYKKKLDPVKASIVEWRWLFFWAIITHPLLDACTAYGTQLFQPFSDYRVAFNNIAVVDPIYTIPFMICVLIAGYLMRSDPRRRFINYLGIALSTGYLAFGAYNKLKADRLFEKTLVEQNIPYNRYMTSPTIFNNILWRGIAEGDSSYYFGSYSLLDKEDNFKDFIIFRKDHELLSAYDSDRSIQILKWFTNGYYNVTQSADGQLQLNDLRYGTRSGEYRGPNDFVFKFILSEKDGKIEAHHDRNAENMSDDLQRMWTRLKGI